MEISKNTKRFFQIILLLFGLLLLVYIIGTSGIIENYRMFFAVSIPLLILAFFLSNMNILSKIYRWSYLSRHYDCPIGLRDASVVTISSFYFANITPGKIGDLFKAYFMQKRYLMDFFDGVSMLFYERFFELLILFLTAATIVFIDLKGITVIVLELCAFMLVLLALFYFKSDVFLGFLEKIIIRLPIVKIPEVSFRIRKIPFANISAVFVITLISLLFEFARLWVVALAFGYTLNPLQVSIFFSLSIVAGLVSQIPLGIGITEGSLSLLLQQVGIPPVSAMSIVLTDRALSMYYALVLGFVFSKFSLDQLSGATS